MAQNFKEIKEIIEKKLKSNVSVINDGTPVNFQTKWNGAANTWITVLTIEIQNFFNLYGKDAPKMSSVSKMLESFYDGTKSIVDSYDDIIDYKCLGNRIIITFNAFYVSYLVNVYQCIVDLNTFVSLYNAIMANNELPPLVIGFGIVANAALTIRKGDEYDGFTTHFVTDLYRLSAKLANVANKNNANIICMNSIFYTNVKEEQEKNNNKFDEWVTMIKPFNDSIEVYTCDIVRASTSDWIEKGFK